MRVSQAEKEKSRDRIVTSAARMLRERGVDGASVADVMSDAGLTHGGFYRHFESKDALVAAALDQAFDGFIATLSAGSRGSDPQTATVGFIKTYLSDGHIAHPGQGCPIPALAADVGRSSPLVKARFSAGVRRMVSAIGQAMPGDDEARRTAAWRQLAMMAGAVMMARSADTQTVAEILAACGGGDSRAD